MKRFFILFITIVLLSNNVFSEKIEYSFYTTDTISYSSLSTSEDSAMYIDSLRGSYEDRLSDNKISWYKIDSTLSYGYKSPKIYEPFVGFFRTYGDVPKIKVNLLSATTVVFSTLLLVKYDQQLIDGAQQFGRYIGLSGDDSKINILPFDHVPVFVPGSFASGLYYLGDGWTQIMITLGMGTYGKIAGSKRAYSTSIQLAEGLMVGGAYSQVIKHITGRQSPNRSTADGGLWRLFPDQVAYHKNVPSYDAFPSGHIASTMLTITILADNYPENRYIKPIGYSLMTVLMYQMMNNGVHWASDYPLSIGLSYILAKMITHRYRIEKSEIDSEHFSLKRDVRFYPMVSDDNGFGLKLNISLK